MEPDNQGWEIARKLQETVRNLTGAPKGSPGRRHRNRRRNFSGGRRNLRRVLRRAQVRAGGLVRAGAEARGRGFGVPEAEWTSMPGYVP